MVSSKYTSWKKNLFLIVKMSLSVLAMTLISRKVNWHFFIAVVQKVDIRVLLVAFSMHNISQLLGAVRSRYYLKEIGIKLDHKSNSCLYYLGMFYNLFLPGGVGGDGYKVYFLKKYYSGKTLSIIKALLFDRFNGLIGLLILAVMTLCVIKPSSLPWLTNTSTCIILLMMISLFYWVHQYMIKSDWKTYSHTLILSVLIQCLQVFACIIIVWSLGEHTHLLTYTLIFLASSISMQLPLSMGGLGAREVTVVYCLNALHIDPTIGLAMAMIYFMIQSLSNCIGVFFIDFKLDQALQIK